MTGWEGSVPERPDDEAASVAPPATGDVWSQVSDTPVSVTVDRPEVADDLLEPAPTTFAQLPLVPATGDPRVDDAVARLSELEALPVEEHLAVYQDVHRRLHETLADLDVG